MNKLLPSLVFSILLLAPVGAHNAFAGSPTVVPCSGAVVMPDPLGDSWENLIDSSGFLPVFNLIPNGEHKVQIGLTDGTIETFDMTPTPSESVLIPIQLLNDVTFTPQPTTQGTLIPLGITTPFLVLPSTAGPTQIFDGQIGIYDPPNYQYTLNGDTFTLDKSTDQSSLDCAPEPESPVGGESLAIDSTALVLGGLQSSAIWMIPVLAGAAGVGITAFKLRRK